MREGGGTMKLGQVFDPRRNALNAFRLALAAEVMLFHSFPITGHMPPPLRAHLDSDWMPEWRQSVEALLPPEQIPVG